MIIKVITVDFHHEGCDYTYELFFEQRKWDLWLNRIIDTNMEFVTVGRDGIDVWKKMTRSKAEKILIANHRNDFKKLLEK